MANNIDIEELITLNYEIEGLLYLALHRGSDTPDSVWRLIKEKVCSLNSILVADSECEETADVVLNDDQAFEEPEQHTSVESVDVTISMDTSCAADIDVAEDDCRQSDEGGSVSEIVIDEREDCINPLIQITDGDTISAEPFEPESELYGPEDSIKEDVSSDIDNQVPEIYTDESNGPLESDDLDGTEFSKDSLRLDEKLARNNSKNLRKAFSLNDKFRFRRELFSNSDTEMADTLNLVDAMTSYSEAEEYFYSDLQWDPEMSEVKDFMSIIKNHFS